MREIISNSERDTELAGERFGAEVPDGAVVAMYGELGSGKTAFVRGMARGMGIDCRVSSPTFTIVNEYLGARELIHFDMYRLASADELWDIGWEDYLARESRSFVEQSFGGSLPAFLAAFTRGKTLTREQQDTLQSLIDEARRKL